MDSFITFIIRLFGCYTCLLVDSKEGEKWTERERKKEREQDGVGRQKERTKRTR